MPSQGYEACTIAVLDPFNNLAELQELPLHLPPKCEQSRMDNLEINTNETSSKQKILNLFIKKVQLINCMFMDGHVIYAKFSDVLQ